MSDTATNHGMSHGIRYLLYLIIGVGIGAGGMAIGAFLASGNNSWTSAIIYSAVGIVGAPLAALSWATHRNRRRMIFAGIPLILGLLATMGILLELTQEYPPVSHALTQAPIAVASWFLIWAVWIVAAIVRLIVYEPPRTRHRLSSRRGDGGA